MPNENREIEKMLDEMGKMIQFIYEKKDGELNDFPEKNFFWLAEIAQYIAHMEEAVQIALEKEDITKEQLEEMMYRPPQTMDPKQRALIKKAARMRRDMDRLYETLAKIMEGKMEEPKAKPSSLFKKTDPKSPAARRNLHIGFKRGWKKL